LSLFGKIILANMALSFLRTCGLAQIRSVRLPRFYSTASLVDVKVDDKSGCAVVSMQKPPVNSLNVDMIQALTKALVELEANKCRGFILTSSSPSVFSAGLDIREMYQTSPERLQLFWSSLQTLWLKLYGSKMANVALINGHSPAGGCLLAMSCDYRVMVAGKSKIGLNETLLGIVAPFWFKDTMLNTIGTRKTELALMLGSLFSPEEALSIGLVDQVAPDLQSASEIAQAQLQAFLKIPATARYLSKFIVREAALKRLSSCLKEDVEQFVSFATQPAVQKGLGMYLESLNKRK